MARRIVVLAALTTLFVTAGCASSASEPAAPHRQAASAEPTAPVVNSVTPPSPSAPPTSSTAVKVPADQQDAQDGVTKYLQQTLDALPKGATLDGTRYVTGPGAVRCDDGTVQVQDPRDVDAPPDTDVTRLVATTGELWRQWGWNVDDAPDQGRPNRVGRTPDGYQVRIEAAADPKRRPTMVGSSPCFAAGLRENDIPRTPVLEQSR